MSIFKVTANGVGAWARIDYNLLAPRFAQLAGEMPCNHLRTGTGRRAYYHAHWLGGIRLRCDCTRCA